MTMTTQQRRSALANWLYVERDGAPYTTTQIVDVSGIYDGMQGRWDKCHADLKRLYANHVVAEYFGRPIRWAHING